MTISILLQKDRAAILEAARLARAAWPKDHYVYIHLRASTLKPFYVGKGQGDRAWHSSPSKRERWWRSIVAKHGVIVLIMQDGLQEWAALELEQDVIALIGRKDLKLGPLVNFTDGGEGASGAVVSEELAARRGVGISKSLQRLYANGHQNSFKGKRHSAETKARMSELKKQTPIPAGFAARIGKGRPGGWSHSEEARIKLSKSRKAKIDAGEIKNANSKEVRLIELDLVFESVATAAAWLRSNGFPRAAHAPIGRVARGMQATAYSYTWRYTKEPEPPKFVPKQGGSPKRKILQVETGFEFESLTHAAQWCKQNGVAKAAPGSIHSVASGRQTTAYGYHWVFVDSQAPL